MSPLCVTATVCDCAIATEVRAPHTAFTAVRFRPLLGLREGGGGLLLRSNVVTSAGVSTNLSSRNTWDYFEFSSPFIQLIEFCGFVLYQGMKVEGLQVVLLKVSKFRKQIMVPKLLPKNKPSSLSWKITTSRLIQKRVYLLAKRT